jgi:hypothetical protein
VVVSQSPQVMIGSGIGVLLTGLRREPADRVADDEPASAQVLAGYAAAGRGWVAVDDSDQPVGYVVVDVMDGAAHIDETPEPGRGSRG